MVSLQQAVDTGLTAIAVGEQLSCPVLLDVLV